MLDWNKVITYIRQRIALPSTFIEKNDKEIRDYIKSSTIPEFSGFYPDWERALVKPKDPQYIHPGKKNHYYIFDDEDLEIFGIKECYFQMDNALITGHPVIPPMSFGGMKWWALEVLKSRMVFPFTMWAHTYTFIHPNIVEVPTDTDLGDFVVEYERMHPSDLRKIPNALQRKFMDLALGDIMIWIGGIRLMYQSIQTPFGEIPLNGQDLLSRGEEIKRDLVQKFEEDSMPPIVVDIY